MCQLYKLNFIADVHKEEKSSIYRAWYMQHITSTSFPHAGSQFAVRWPFLQYCPPPLKEGLCYNPQSDLKLILLQSQPLKCWDYRPAPSCYGIPYSMLHSWYKSKFICSKK